MGQLNIYFRHRKSSGRADGLLVIHRNTCVKKFNEKIYPQRFPVGFDMDGTRLFYEGRQAAKRRSNNIGKQMKLQRAIASETYTVMHTTHSYSIHVAKRHDSFRTHT